MNTSSAINPIIQATLSSANTSSVVQMEADETDQSDSSSFDVSPNAMDIKQDQEPQLLLPSKVNVFDVAAYILEKCGEMSALKLQKLVYYCQAWSLVWDDEPLFPERIEAWAHGPVVKELYDYHRGLFRLSRIPVGSPFKLSPTQKRTIDAVVKFYGAKEPWHLAELTHLEDPWKNARQGVPVGAPSSREITQEAMQAYYSSLI